MQFTNNDNHRTSSLAVLFVIFLVMFGGGLGILCALNNSNHVEKTKAIPANSQPGSPPMMPGRNG